jgi:hypothetical protein
MRYELEPEVPMSWDLATTASYAHFAFDGWEVRTALRDRRTPTTTTVTRC